MVKPPIVETAKEHIPSTEEVRDLFEQCAKGEPFEETRRREDEKGLYLLEVKVLDEDGGYAEYSYMRKGRYAEGQAQETRIDVVYFDEDDIPMGGDSFAKHEGEKWSVVG